MKNRTLLAGSGCLVIFFALLTSADAAPLTIVSTNSRPGVSGAGPSFGPVFSGDGQTVAFVSAARNLVGGYPASPYLDVMIRHLDSRATRTVSVRYPTGGGGNGDSMAPSISSNGQWVAFASSAVNLLPPLAGYTDTNDASDVFIRNLEMGQTMPVSLNADGRYVAYADGTNAWRWDRVLVTNELVSLNLDELPLTNGPSRIPAISHDGRQVMFYSTAGGLVTNAVNGSFQLYLRDMATASTRLVTSNAAGAAANRDSYPGTAVFSPDGMSVAFDGLADNLVTDDANRESDVFLYRSGSNGVELVSLRTSDRPSASSVGGCFAAPTGVSSNGQAVVFGRTDNQLASSDAIGRRDWFAMNLASGTQTAVTSDLQEISRGYPSISADGRFVAIATTNIYSSDFMAVRLHRLDLASGARDTVTNVSVPVTPYVQNILQAYYLGGLPNTNLALLSPDGGRIAFGFRSLFSGAQLQIYDFGLQTNRILASPGDWLLNFAPLAFSPDGRWLAYTRVLLDSSKWNIYLCDLGTPEFPVQALVTNMNRYLPRALAFSADGRYLAYPVGDSGWSLYRHRLDAGGPNLFVCTNCSEPSISSDGRFVAYVRQSYPSPGLRRDDILVKDLQTGVEQLVSVNRFGTNAANGMSYAQRITPDGRYVVFTSAASDLVENDTNKFTDVFLRDRLLGTTTCLSLNQQGLPANDSSANPVLSGDGRTLVFQSTASDLVFADYNLHCDVFAVRIGHDDIDNDGLDDDWELAFFEDLTHDGSADSDSDGLSDHAEFLAGTDPTNLGSVLRVTTLVPQGDGNTAIFWQAVPRRTYQVQFKDSLDDTNWSVLPGSVTANTTTAMMIDTTASGQPQRFYRAMVPHLIPATAAQFDYLYTTNDGSITITGYSGSAGTATIPSTIDGFPVTRIGGAAFIETSLTNVLIPNSVTGIGSFAFYGCSLLTSFTVPDSVTNLGDSVFQSCSKLSSVIIGINVPRIGSNAFKGCTSLTNVVIPNSVIGIGSAAFHGCSLLTSVTVPDSVTDLGDSVFQSCSKLTSVNIGNSVTRIGNNAFNGCSSLTSVTIPNSVTIMGDSAFQSCGRLTNAIIGNSVTTIGNSAFYYCTNLTDVAIPNGVTRIGYRTFYSCGSLTSVTIPDSVIDLGDEAFHSCSRLTNAIIGNSVTVIPNKAFYLCHRLSSATIGNSVRSIGSEAFNGCNSLANVTIPGSVETIEDFAFYYCGSLASVTIPGSVTNMGHGTYTGCANLSAIMVDGFNAFFSSVDGVLFDKNQTTLIQYPGGKAGGGYTIPNSVTSIGDFAVAACVNLTNVTIPNSVLTIHGNAFSGCNGLTGVVIPDGVTSIGDSAFSGCFSLTNVSITNSVTRIGNTTFLGCASLLSLTIPASVTSIGWLAIADCFSLTAVYFQGDAPSLDGPLIWEGDQAPIAYYLPGTTGWSPDFGGLPTVLLNP